MQSRIAIRVCVATSEPLQSTAPESTCCARGAAPTSSGRWPSTWFPQPSPSPNEAIPAEGYASVLAPQQKVVESGPLRQWRHQGEGGMSRSPVLNMVLQQRPEAPGGA